MRSVVHMWHLESPDSRATLQEWVEVLTYSSNEQTSPTHQLPCLHPGILIQDILLWYDTTSPMPRAMEGTWERLAPRLVYRLSLPVL